MSYLNSGQINSVNAGFNALHNFFAKKNVFYAIKEGEKTIVSTSNNHNAFFNGAPQNSQVIKTRETGIFNARAYYLNKNTNFNEINFGGNSSPIGANVAENAIKVIVDDSGKMFFDGVKKIEWDGELYDLMSTPKRHGLLVNSFHTYFLKEAQ